MSNIYESLAKVENGKFKKGIYSEASKLDEDKKKSGPKTKGLKIGKLNGLPVIVFSLLFVLMIGANIIFYNQQKQNSLVINESLVKFQEIENMIDYNNQQISILLNNFSEIENNFQTVTTDIDKIESIMNFSSATLSRVDSRISNLEKDNANRKIAIKDINDGDNELLKKYSELRVKLEKLRYQFSKSEEITTEPIIVSAELETN